MYRFFRSKIYVALTLVVFTLLVGILGFKIIAGYNWVDAVYMTVITRNEEIIERFENEKTLFVKGNANEDETLVEAGITRAHTLITALPDDADNLFVVLSARQLNKKLHIISRAEFETSHSKLKLAGANSVVMPNRIGGDHMASLVVHPDLIEFLDNLSVVGEGDSTNVEEISFDLVCPDGKEATIKSIDLRNKTGCTIIGYKTPKEL